GARPGFVLHPPRQGDEMQRPVRQRAEGGFLPPPDGRGEIVFGGGAEAGARAAPLPEAATAAVEVTAAREGAHVVQRPDDGPAAAVHAEKGTLVQEARNPVQV